MEQTTMPPTPLAERTQWEDPTTAGGWLQGAWSPDSGGVLAQPHHDSSQMSLAEFLRETP